MKHVIYFLTALLFIAGCSQYEYNLSDPGLTVKESLLEFAASGGEGYILVESNTAIEAKSNSDWCQIKVNGMKIEVTVAPYDGIVNRTAVVSLTTGKNFPVNVPVTQSASRFKVDHLVFDLDFTPASVKTAVSSDHEVIVSTDDDWINAVYENGFISITVLKNNNANPRAGVVEVKSNNITQTIVIRQGGKSLAFEDMLGDYEMKYQTSGTSAVFTKNIHFAQSTVSGAYTVTGLDLGKLEVKFNNTSKTLEIYAGQNMGKDPSNPARTIVPLVFSREGYISWGTNYYYRGVWNNSFDSDMMFTFEDIGIWANNTIFGIYLVFSTQYPVVSGSYTYAGFAYVNITMKKL